MKRKLQIFFYGVTIGNQPIQQSRLHHIGAKKSDMYITNPLVLPQRRKYSGVIRSFQHKIVKPNGFRWGLIISNGKMIANFLKLPFLSGNFSNFFLSLASNADNYIVHPLLEKNFNESMKFFGRLFSLFSKNLENFSTFSA